MKKNRDNLGVSELLGTILLLAIVVVTFALIFFNLTEYSNIEEQTFVSIVGTTDENCIVLEHRGGELLSLDTEISVIINGTSEVITARDFLDDESKKDGLWSLGEKIIYPVKIDAFNLSATPKANIAALDGVSNSLIMMGLIDVDVVCDIGLDLKINNSNPEIGTNVEFILTLTNYGNINITGIEVNFSLPSQLIHISNYTICGVYKNNTGIWNIYDILNVDESVELIIEAKVKEYGTGISTQMAIIMDGSETTNKADWEMAMNGVASVIKNQSHFPPTGGVELTIVQFGASKPSIARQEIGPIIIDDTNNIIIANDIKNITQLEGRQPTACGFYLAADILANSGFFSTDKKQVILLVSRGNPTECCNDDGGYEEDTCSGESGPKESSFSARDYLVNKLLMTKNQDKVNVISVGHSSPQHEEWLIESVWPLPGYWAPPFEGNRTEGWACQVNDWEGFIETIDDIFADAFSEITINVEVASTDFTDPKMSNNFCTILIY